MLYVNVMGTFTPCQLQGGGLFRVDKLLEFSLMSTARAIKV
jgi:hypothetical protein